MIDYKGKYLRPMKRETVQSLMVGQTVEILGSLITVVITGKSSVVIIPMKRTTKEVSDDNT